MAVKSISSGNKTVVKKFPKLMINSLYVMLFGTAGIGTVVKVITSSGAAWEVGHQSISIPMGDYEDYTGNILLTNK